MCTHRRFVQEGEPGRHQGGLEHYRSAAQAHQKNQLIQILLFIHSTHHLLSFVQVDLTYKGIQQLVGTVFYFVDRSIAFDAGLQLILLVEKFVAGASFDERVSADGTVGFVLKPLFDALDVILMRAGK